MNLLDILLVIIVGASSSPDSWRDSRASASASSRPSAGMLFGFWFYGIPAEWIPSLHQI